MNHFYLDRVEGLWDRLREKYSDWPQAVSDVREWQKDKGYPASRGLETFMHPEFDKDSWDDYQQIWMGGD